MVLTFQMFFRDGAAAAGWVTSIATESSMLLI
jgi:hypothetical protein